MMEVTLADLLVFPKQALSEEVGDETEIKN